MVQICQRCKSANPRDALYCYRDGAVLDHRAGADAPADGSAMNIGARPFTAPLVFPSGRSCHNFVQLGAACQEEPAGVQELLHSGHMETFLAGQGRLDLAKAAHAAGANTNLDRGLDEFLGRLPIAASPAQLRAEQTAIDLGTLRVGEDRHITLKLRNKGDRLLYGSASADVPWLAFGDGRAASKVFQFPRNQTLEVRVVGAHLRAFDKPLEGRIVLDSNGGSITVLVKAIVPVTPFPDGVLAGAQSPRQLAHKAKEQPKEAAKLIESGAVARWYQANGWIYPVRGPSATGVAAVQQLFEALGLVKPPKVELSEDAIRLAGAPGQKLEHVLTAHTDENRSVVAHGQSDQAWLTIGATIFRGRSAFMPLLVAAVPQRPGEALQATIAVTANGNQRFSVPVTLAIAPPAGAPAPAPKPAPPVKPTPPSPPPGAPSGHPAVVPLPLPAAPSAPPITAQTSRASLSLTLLPALLLVMAVLAAAGRDYLATPTHTTGPAIPQSVDATPRLEIRFHDELKNDELEKLWLPGSQPTMRFGLVMLQNGKPLGEGANITRLTFDPWGRTNNTCLRFDGKDERLFGGPEGVWEERETKEWKDEQGHDHRGVRSIWICDDKKVKVTQFVELVRGEQTGLLDTCRVQYRLEGLPDAPEHKVGIRFLLDTFIGGNDGVPFTIPGDPALCDTKKDLPKEAHDRNLPDFLQALEKPDLAHPGTIAHLRLKLDGLEPPTRVTLGAWPNEKLRILDKQAAGPATMWAVPLLPLKSLDLDDSAVTIYWAELPLKPGAARNVGFEYGLWNLARAGSRLAAIVDGAFRPAGELTVIAYVNRTAADPAEKLTLTLPEGFKLLEGNATQDVPPLPPGINAGNVPITWKVQAGPTGKYDLTVTSSAGPSQSLAVEIRKAIF